MRMGINADWGRFQCEWGLGRNPPQWPSGIGVHLERNRLRVRVLAVSDTLPMFIEPAIDRVPSGFSGCIWLDTRIVLKCGWGGINADGEDGA